ncbi:class I SAM-dependent methyltransferase [bacterium]|nr:class I SAM-dependent methyltransferase [bacterium]
MSKENHYPEFVARFYDVIYDTIRTSVDHDYYLAKMKTSRGPVLEVGVGTGRLFADALKQGVDIYGIDVNQTMLDQLQLRIPASENHRINLADVRDFSLNMKFDLMVAPFRVMSHLLNVEDQLAALRRIKTHLETDGTFIWDVFVPDPVLCSKGLEPTMEFDGFWKEGKKLQRIISVKPEPSRQINHATMRFIWDDDDGKHDETWTFPLHYFYRYEIEHLLQIAGFKIIDLFGDFQEHKLDDTSKDFVVVCGK